MFPAESVKVYVTGVEPVSNSDPGWCVWNTVTMPPLSSVAVGSDHDTETWRPIGAVNEMVSGQSMTVGATPSVSKVVNVWI